jgi:exodeoxyribonuclease V alpha subunit
MLQRNLLYTGVTRGKRLVVLVGQKKAVAIAVRNVSGRRRWSNLQAICGDARAVQSASELTRKEDVAQFRATIGFHGPEIFRRLKIVEIQGGVLVRGGSRVDDARGSRG